MPQILRAQGDLHSHSERVVANPSVSPTRQLLIGKQDAGLVRKTLKFCDDLTFDECGANTCCRNWVSAL
jgi:hypothetical protein